MFKLNTISFVITILILTACEKPKKDYNLAAKYDGGEISLAGLDETIKDELFEQLYGVYYLRYIALEELIAESLLKEEAERAKISREQLLELNVYAKLDSTGLNEYKKRFQVRHVSDPSNPRLSFAVESEEGKKRVWESYKQWAVGEYCKDLANKYHVERLLTPPVSPVSDLDSIDYVSAGNRKSKVNVWIMSDYDCPSCQASYPAFHALYAKYSDKVEFRYTYLSTVPTFPAIACECADKVGQFKAVYDYLYKTKNRDSLGIVKSASTPTTDARAFESCVRNRDTRERMRVNLKRLAERGIDKTPSVFVNGRLFYGQLSEKALTDYIEYCLKK